MIEIRIVKDKSGDIKKMVIKGHSGYGPHGSDIVCSAVSALAYTGAGALSDINGISEFVERDGFMEIRIFETEDRQSREKAQIILETIIKGFIQIEAAYKKNVQVRQEEVRYD